MTDPIKESFKRVKEDIDILKDELSFLRGQLDEIKRTLNTTQKQTDQQTDRQINQTGFNTDPAEHLSSTHFSTDNYPLEASKRQNFIFSTRNKGVSTDRQTDQQTDISTGNEGVQFQEFAQTVENPTNHKGLDRLEKLAEVINSLDTIKKDLRIQFKKLTKQEMSVFTAIYQLEEQGFTVDYSLISQKLNLTESSIRDYVQRMLKKGIPIEKYRENNKKILLKISGTLKKVASLQTIHQLREI